MLIELKIRKTIFKFTQAIDFASFKLPNSI